MNPLNADITMLYVYVHSIIEEHKISDRFTSNFQGIGIKTSLKTNLWREIGFKSWCAFFKTPYKLLWKNKKEGGVILIISEAPIKRSVLDLLELWVQITRMEA